MHIDHKTDYRSQRQAAYPTIGDQLDAIAALAAALRTPPAVKLPPAVTEWLTKLDHVKATYPKPPGAP